MDWMRMRMEEVLGNFNGKWDYGIQVRNEMEIELLELFKEGVDGYGNDWYRFKRVGENIGLFFKFGYNPVLIMRINIVNTGKKKVAVLNIKMIDIRYDIGNIKRFLNSLIDWIIENMVVKGD